MRSKGYKIFFLLCLAMSPALAQFKISGTIVDAVNKTPIRSTEILNVGTNDLFLTDSTGYFEIQDLDSGTVTLLIFAYQYQPLEKAIVVFGDVNVTMELRRLEEELSEVVVKEKKEQFFSLNRLKPVEGTAIYAGKKSEVILMEQTVGNLASNNARQIYSQVVGLNIYENGDGGLQLNIGGRGLDPNRTVNFNTRQNGYDISADVLGYPESYYTPPAEALEEIQVVRGAASLQYGTQFGGLINFKFKKPDTDKKLALTSRQSFGSFDLFTSFNSLSGTVGKFSYYTYFNYKQGDSFRPNSAFDSRNFYADVRYRFTKKTSLSFETTLLNYLAKQPGGLTDTQFLEDPDFSNRTRNWFQVDWKLYALKIKHKFSAKTDLSINIFGLDASRNAVGFRGNPSSLNINPITEIDEQDVNGNFINPRDLIKDQFRNWGVETRLLTRYKLGVKDAVFLIGYKYYKANNTSQQGPGTSGADANFNFADDQFPDYANQANFVFPNLNLALFGEHIFYWSKRFTITPGFRVEHIKTKSDGTYREVRFDNAGNPIFNEQFDDDRNFERSFLLLGLGMSYKPTTNLEGYVNFSQNYRSITFNDIRVVNPTFIIDPDITDEEGFTGDFGIRGKWKKYLSYDIGGFGLLYDNRIGIILNDRANRVRKNIGTALIYGLETFVDWNLIETFSKKADSKIKLNWFVNVSITQSEYINSEENGVEGNQVEFIPLLNLKTGLRAGIKNFRMSIQYTYLSEQYTDAQNSEIPFAGDLREGVIGNIPAYDILDLSLSYTFKRYQLETGINNLLDKHYFTRRATGYPGPGIIPSSPQSFYLTLGVLF